ncbi:MAG: acyl-CoA dehydrogenase [Deltaproteobacteria bacterium]|nr:acyl-CoA dehydrogenase [Deltaproteobacteria bacterium]
MILSQEHILIQNMARDFALKEIRPVAAKFDETHEFPKEIIQKLGKLGLMGVAIPEKYAGSGLDCLSYAIAMEEISRGCAGVSVVMSVNNSLVGDPLLKFGTEEQKEKYLKPLASGQRIGCFMLSEPQSGSDAINQKTSAVKENDYYILNGTKNFITNGPQAHFGIVFASSLASSGRGGGSNSISAFIVEKNFSGYKIGKSDRKLGIAASGTCQIHFDQCKVPKENLLGDEGKGLKIAFSTLDGGRIGIAAQAVGIAVAAMEASVSYAKERKQFGRTIGEFQAVQWMLADMSTKIDAARLLVYRAAQLKDQGKPYSIESAKAKLFASQTVMEVTTDAVQIFGGYGYMKDYPVEKYYRDAKITQIYEGTSEVQRMVIARGMLR